MNISLQTICTLGAVTIIAALTLLHFIKNLGSYSTFNKAALPIFYVSSIALLFITGYYSLVFAAHFILITLLKCALVSDHVRQMTWDFSGPGFRKNPANYIVINDTMALIFILVIKTFFWMQQL